MKPSSPSRIEECKRRKREAIARGRAHLRRDLLKGVGLVAILVIPLMILGYISKHHNGNASPTEIAGK